MRRLFQSDQAAMPMPMPAKTTELGAGTDSVPIVNCVMEPPVLKSTTAVSATSLLLSGVYETPLYDAVPDPLDYNQ